MKIRVALTGGGTGGHLFPLLAVADQLINTAQTQGVDLRLTYFGPRNEMADEFVARDIAIGSIASSKLRRYWDIRNIIDIPMFFIGIIQALIRLYDEMPDVLFSKGGPGALPVVLAAKFYAIPIVIHESDAVPSLTTRITAKFAKRILLAFPEAAVYFPEKKTAVIGNPVRDEFIKGFDDIESLKQQAGLDTKLPNILVIGGSQGAKKINDFIVDSLDVLLPEFQVTHQTGNANYDSVMESAQAILHQTPEFRSRYHPVAFLTPRRMREAIGAADIVISRAGSGAIFEISALQKPSILIPLEGSANGHQKANAYAYARSGAAEVVEQENLTKNLIMSVLHAMIKDGEANERRKLGARNFFKPLAARSAADEILLIAG